MKSVFLPLVLIVFAYAQTVQVLPSEGGCQLKIQGDVLAVLVRGDVKPSADFEGVVTAEGRLLLLAKSARHDPVVGYVAPGSSVEVLQVLGADMRVASGLGTYRCEMTTTTRSIVPPPISARPQQVSTTYYIQTASRNDIVIIASALIIIIAAAVAAALILGRKR